MRPGLRMLLLYVFGYSKTSLYRSYLKLKIIDPIQTSLKFVLVLVCVCVGGGGGEGGDSGEGWS